MAKAEWTKYFALSDDGVFWGLEQYKDKLPVLCLILKKREVWYLRLRIIK